MTSTFGITIAYKTGKPQKRFTRITPFPLMIVLEDHPNTAQTATVMTADEKHRYGPSATEATEITVSPGDLVQVLNMDARPGAMPHCRFTLPHDQTPHTVYLNCRSPCLGINSNASSTVAQQVQYAMLAGSGFSGNDILEASGLLDAADLPIALLSSAQRLRLQALLAVLQGADVLVFNSPWAQKGTDNFILDLLRFLRRRPTQRKGGSLPVFVVCDCGNLPALSILADSIWEVEYGKAIEVEMAF